MELLVVDSTPDVSSPSGDVFSVDSVADTKRHRLTVVYNWLHREYGRKGGEFLLLCVVVARTAELFQLASAICWNALFPTHVAAVPQFHVMLVTLLSQPSRLAVRRLVLTNALLPITPAVELLGQRVSNSCGAIAPGTE